MSSPDSREVLRHANASAAAAVTPLEAPGPRAFVPGVASLLSFRRFTRDPLSFLAGLARDYGDAAQFRLGPQRVFFFNRPDYTHEILVTRHADFIKGRALQRSKRLLGEGLLTSEGQFWLRQRRLVQPAFHRQRVASYARVMSEYAARASARWHDGESFDVSREMMRLTLAVVGKTLFDADVEGDAGAVGEALNEVMEMFGVLMMPYSELLERLPLKPAPVRRFERARARLDKVIYRVIEERRRTDVDRGDLLSMLLLAQDEEAGCARMSDEQVRDEAMTLFLAGHETTANALTWTWHLLAQHPEVEARFHAEVDEVTQAGARLPEAEDYARLRYTEMVVAEAMRLYPPAWALGRLTVRDTSIGGYRVPARSLVLVSQYVAHRDPRHWADPESFDPERWTPEARAARPQFAYFPFGGGQRRCVGESFAWTELLLIVATLASRWRLAHAPGAPAVEFSPGITLRPGRRGVLMTAARRHQH